MAIGSEEESDGGDNAGENGEDVLNRISGPEKNVKPGENFEIPVSIQNNTGLMGFVFDLTFDVDAIKVNSVKSGEVIPSGTQFDYSLDEANPGQIRVLWAGTDEMETDSEKDKVCLDFIR